MISSDKLKELRHQHGWSQEQLATISGVSVRTIQRIEKSGECSLESKMALAGAFSVSVEYLNNISGDGYDYKGVSFKDNLVSWAVLLVILFGILLVSGSGSIYERLHINLFVMAAFWLASVIRAQGSESVGFTCKLVLGIFSKTLQDIPVRQSIINLNQQIKLVYASALFAFVFLALQLLDGNILSSEQSVDRFVMQMAQSAIAAIIYSVFFAEFLLRSAKLKLENYLILSASVDG